MIRLRQGFGGRGPRAQSGVSLMVVAVMLAGVGALALIAGALQPMRAEQTGGVVPWRTLALPATLARDRRGGLIAYRVATGLTAERALLDAAVSLDGEAAALASAGDGRGGAVTRALPVAALLRRARLAGR